MPTGAKKGNKNGFKKGHLPWNKGKKGVMPIPWNKGVPRTQKEKENIGLSLKGEKAWNKGLKGVMPIPWNKGKKFPQVSGEKNVNWKGGITPINSKIRGRLDYVLWHKSILERDNFTCQKTGIRGGKLQVHHINNFAEFPEIRFAIDNGITLSKKAHDEFHKIYGRKNNTREQLEEFLNTIP